MAIPSPQVSLVYSQAEMNAALATICALIDADRLRLDAIEAAATAAAASMTAQLVVAGGMVAATDKIRRRQRKNRVT
jgi:hypothetical protein